MPPTEKDKFCYCLKLFKKKMYLPTRYFPSGKTYFKNYLNVKKKTSRQIRFTKTFYVQFEINKTIKTLFNTKSFLFVSFLMWFAKCESLFLTLIPAGIFSNRNVVLAIEPQWFSINLSNQKFIFFTLKYTFALKKFTE